jgi:hypothetical protein
LPLSGELSDAEEKPVAELIDPRRRARFVTALSHEEPDRVPIYSVY